MKKRLFPQYIKEIFSSPKFYISVLIITAIALLGNATNNQKGSLCEFAASSPGFGFFRIVAYVPACLPFITSFCDDYTNRYVRAVVVRSGVRRYSLSKFAAAFLSAFISLFLGFALVLFILSFKLPLFDVFNNQSFIVYGYFISHGMPVVYILIKVFIYSLWGATYAVMGLVVSAVIPNKFLTFATPYAACSILDEIGYGLRLPHYLNTLHLGVGERVFGGSVTVPDGLGMTLLNFGYTVLFAAVLCLLLYLAFDILVERRVHN